MKPRRIPIISLLVGVAFPLACGWGAPGDDYDLAAPGYVKCCGGCISYVASTLTFTPLKNGDVLVRHEGDFLHPGGVSDPQPLEYAIDGSDARVFFRGLRKIFERPEKTNKICTRRAVIDVYLPLKGGDLKVRWVENECGYDVDDLLSYLSDFIQDFYDDAPAADAGSRNRK
jgi:hypothetical protein